MSTLLDSFRDRLLAAAPGRVMDAEPSPDSLGAREGTGLRFDNGATVGLYEFDSFEAANQAALDWERGAGAGTSRQGATNGVVMFAGAIDMPDESGSGHLFALGGLVSAFAGRE